MTVAFSFSTLFSSIKLTLTLDVAPLILGIQKEYPERENRSTRKCKKMDKYTPAFKYHNICIKIDKYTFQQLFI
jgi:hypothetical protein